MRTSAFSLAAALSVALWSPTLADTYQVPTADFPTIQSAVLDAEGNADLSNTIELIEPVVFTNTKIWIRNAIAPSVLTIRPGAGLLRATIASTNGGEPIVHVDDVPSGVVLEDLDLIRSATNAADLVYVFMSHNVTIERCRIGSNWSTPGAAGFSNVRIIYPFDVLVRNCILFSYVPANLDQGVYVTAFSDALNALRLYNNDVADYKFFGIHVDDAGGNPAALLLLRNNVCANHPNAPIAVEPRAYRSDVHIITVVKSHNVAFATDDAHAETVAAGGISIAGDAANHSFLRLTRPEIDFAFEERTWIAIPAWDPNVDFFDLVAAGPLHTPSSRWGQNVGDGFPHDRDVALHDDIDREVRPGGDPLHSDRGADQLEGGLATGVEDRLGSADVLEAAPRHNPARSLELRFRAPAAGRLTLEVFDLGGRRLHRAERTVAAGEIGTWEWRSPRASMVVCYRLRLRGTGVDAEARGRAVLLR